MNCVSIVFICICPNQVGWSQLKIFFICTHSLIFFFLGGGGNIFVIIVNTSLLCYSVAMHIKKNFIF